MAAHHLGGVWGLALMYIAEAMGAPWPVEIPLWLSGHLALKGVVGFVPLVLITWLSTSVGNVAAFWLARVGGRPLLDRLARSLRLEHEVQRAEGWLARYGLWAVVGARWINFGFGITLWVVGFARTNVRRTLGVVLVNNLLWAGAWVLLSRLLVRRLGEVGLPGWVLLLPAVLVVLGLAVWRAIRKRSSVTGSPFRPLGGSCASHADPRG